ncbi:restriction endonuclease subunit S [Pseudomonas fluorescens]|uniref:restriction endonuclease subunit S n=1 Tax=Pseudomonas fluorescens TaxID=294 RepID=UPI0017842B64|nr:restriction endonuclease subunit S [Pseudomonas fluorescens]MBD8191490.1 restriction endonuclease subunit S [Pseudomonas fluorescens]MBD8225525.1 restriction endonuclease subunit S [Pseudomonas fluorescens]MBD8783239.1 restriction endonuclease subunit S [Pseudomonas fluorescens]MBD8816661.1 restriction endonuclease subunit S [Pseudomonas fluorescens]
MKWHSFSDVVTDATAKFTKIKASDYQAQGRYKIIDQGKERIAGYTDDENLVNSQLLPILIFGDHTRALKYEDDPIALGADGAKALWVNPNLANARYVYYYLRSIEIKAAGYSRHFKYLKEIEIPIPFKDGAPSFEDQARIVHILDKSEKLVFQRRQHLQEFDNLIKSIFLRMFGNNNNNNNGWPSMPLSSVATDGKGTFSNGPFGSDLLTSELTGAGVPVIYIRDIRHASYERVSTVFVTTEKAQALSACSVQPGDVLIAKVGDPPGTAAIYPQGEPIGVMTQDVIRIRPNTEVVNAEFLVSFLNSEMGCQLIRGITVEATRARFGLREFKMQEMIIPPMDLQIQFSTLVANIDNLKRRYQQSLIDLQTLYHALRQQAFRGELDLSRVSIPDIQDEEVKAVVVEIVHTPPAQSLVIVLPDTSNALYALEDAKARAALISEWLESYRSQLGSTLFSVQHFITAAHNRLAELRPDTDFELGADDFEYIKGWVFEALDAGKLAQAFDDTGNRVELKAVQV